MGFFEGLNVEKYDRQYSDRQLMRRIGDYFRPQAGRLAGVMLLIVAIGAVSAVWPVLVSRLVDVLATQPTLQLITLAGVALAVIGILQWGAELGAPEPDRARGGGRGAAAASPGLSRRRPNTTYRSTISSHPAGSSRASPRTAMTSANWW